MQKPNYWPAGLFMCAFPALIFLRLHLENISISLEGVILLSLFIFSGIWVILLGLFNSDTDSILSRLLGSLWAIGFAVLAFVVAWHHKDGWTGGIPFIPAAWNQAIARTLFSLGGLLSLISAFVFLRKAFKRIRENGDDGT